MPDLSNTTTWQDAENAAWETWRPRSVPRKRDVHIHGFYAGMAFAHKQAGERIQELETKLKGLGR